MHHSLSARPTVSNQYTAFDKSRLTSRENPGTGTECSQAVYEDTRTLVLAVERALSELSNPIILDFIKARRAEINK